MESKQTFEALNELLSRYTRPHYLTTYAPKRSKNEFINTLHYLGSKKYIKDYDTIYSQIENLLKNLSIQTGKLVFESEIKDDLGQIENTLLEQSYFLPTDELEAIKVDRFLSELDFADPNNVLKKNEIINNGNILVSIRIAHNCRKLRTLFLNELDNYIGAEHIEKVDNLKISFTNNGVEPRNIDLLTIQLNKYGFLELDKLKSLTKKDNIIELIASNDLPYKIAMFDFLGFLYKINKEFANNVKSKRNTIVSEILNCNVDGVKKNILTLNDLHEQTEVFRKRYTAHQHTETVKKDYFNLTI